MKTELYLGLNAENIDKELIKDFCGVGLIRGEYLCRYINEYVTLPHCQNYIENYLNNICKKFKKKEVWYRFTDLTSNEISTLNGADSIELEKWHFIGTKGARRYLKFQNTFEKECEIVKNVYEKNKNLGIIIPYIKDIDEYKKLKSIIRNCGYSGKIGIMVEIPSIYIQLEKIIEIGVDNITVGLNDLTSLLLGTYRNSEYHDKTHKSVLYVVKEIQKVCNKNQIIFSLAGYFNKKEIEFYIKHNVNRIIINYANLPELGDKYNSLKEIELLSEIKKNTKIKRKLIENMEKGTEK